MKNHPPSPIKELGNPNCNRLQRAVNYGGIVTEVSIDWPFPIPCITYSLDSYLCEKHACMNCHGAAVEADRAGIVPKTAESEVCRVRFLP